MKKVMLVVTMLILLGTIELFAQYQYNFEFDVISSAPFLLEVSTKEFPDSPWVLRTPPSGYYGGSQVIYWDVNCPPTISYVRVRAWAVGGGYFEEIRGALLHSVNYFYIDLRVFKDPTPPNPTGGGDE